MKKIFVLILLATLSQSISAQLNVNHYINRGRAQLYAEKFTDAIESFSIVIRVKPNVAESYFLRGIAKYNLMDYLGAEQDYTKAIELKPNHTDALRYRGYTRLNLKKYYVAINDFDNAIKLNAIEPDFYTIRGLCKININQYSQAVTDFDKSLEITKKNKRAYFYRGIAKNMLEDTLGALSDFDKALSFDPNFFEVYMNKGILYSEWHKYDTAIINFTKVIEIDPLNSGAYVNKALAYYHLQKTDVSVMNLDTAIQIEPDNSLALFNRALIKNELKKSKEAIRDLDKVIKLNPQNILTFFNRGLMKLDMEDLQGAFMDFTQAIEIYPDFAKAYLNRSIVRHKLNDAQGAFADKEKANEIIASVKQNSDSHVSYADTTENLQSLITLKSSSRFYNNPRFNEQITPEENYSFVYGVNNSKYFKRLSVLFINIEFIKNEYESLGLVIANEIEDVYETDFINSEIERLNSEYNKSENKVYNLIQSSIYKSMLKNYNEALSDLNLALKKDPNNFVAYYCRANVRSEMIDYIQQLESESEIILLNPTNTSTTKVNTLETNQSYLDYEFVINDYVKSLELAPQFTFSAFNLANTLLKTREYRKAIELYDKIIKLEPVYAEAYYNRGLTYIYLKETENGCLDMSVAGELGLEKAYTVIARFCEN
ncbi:MAG: tetratricopeptide repeat protein [Bacteroidales bacterium]|nr:tetratricopeptide repeat protein [Bacteroidales bacterium]